VSLGVHWDTPNAKSVHASLFVIYVSILSNWGFCSNNKDAYYGQVPTINQETAIGGTEPTETMLKFRSGQVIRPNDKNKNKVRHSFIKHKMKMSLLFIDLK
jgi:hypothetical protein